MLLIKGGLGLLVCDVEDEQANLIHRQVIFANLPCSVNECTHEQKVYIENDGSGFYRIRPCVLENGPKFVPYVQHGKDTSQLNVTSKLATQSSLCNFLALQCIKDILRKPRLHALAKYSEAIMFGFKSVMRSFNEQSHMRRQEKLIQFIRNCIPDTLVPLAVKTNFTDYLSKCWFESSWRDSFTAEVMYSLAPVARKNPLVLTNNITERKFRDINESVFMSKMNKLVSTQVHKFGM